MAIKQFNVSISDLIAVISHYMVSTGFIQLNAALPTLCVCKSGTIMILQSNQTYLLQYAWVSCVQGCICVWY